MDHNFLDPLLATEASPSTEFGDYSEAYFDSGSVNKRRLDDGSESPQAGPSSKKSKGDGDREPKKRGSKACLCCRKLKMRCIFVGDGPCQRCVSQGSECVFEASQRGKRKGMKAKDQADASIKQMEETLETILRAVFTSDPSLLANAASKVTPKLEDKDGSALRNLLYPAFATVESTTSVRPVPLTSTALASSRATTESKRSEQATSVGPSTSSGVPEVRSPRLGALPDNDLNPLGLLADASLRNTQRTADLHALVTSNLQHFLPNSRRPFTETHAALLGPAGTKLGPANAEFYRPGPIANLTLRKHLIEQRMMPSILLNHIITPAEAIELFDLYFDRCAIHNGLLSVEFHTPQLVASRSPFLFTCITAVASKFYIKKPDLYSKVMEAAQDLAVDVIRSAYKSVEVIQGFLLLTTWSQPSFRYEEDKSWTYAGLAIRMGQELGLFRKREAAIPEDVDDATRMQFCKEVLNRERTWLYLFVVDRSLSATCGRPYTLREDYIIRSANEWWKQEGTMTRDVSLCAMVAFHCQNGRALDLIYSATDTPNALNRMLDYKLLYKVFTQQIASFGDHWNPRVIKNAYNAIAGRFYVTYYTLGLAAFCLQLAVENNVAEDISRMTQACFEAASQVCNTFSGPFRDSGTLQTCTDNILIFTSYSACFLLKLLASPVTPPDAVQVFASVDAVIETMEAVAVDQTHSHFLYAAFLKVLVNAKRQELGIANLSPNLAPNVQPLEAPPVLDHLGYNPHLEALMTGGFWDDMHLFSNPPVNQGVANNPWEEFLVYSRPPSPGADFDMFAQGFANNMN